MDHIFDGIDIDKEFSTDAKEQLRFKFMFQKFQSRVQKVVSTI